MEPILPQNAGPTPPSFKPEERTGILGHMNNNEPPEGRAAAPLPRTPLPQPPPPPAPPERPAAKMTPVPASPLVAEVAEILHEPLPPAQKTETPRTEAVSERAEPQTPPSSLSHETPRASQREEAAVPPPPPPPSPTPVSQEIPLQEKKETAEETWLKASRTYKSDVSGTIETGKKSLADIAVAEQLRREEGGGGASFEAPQESRFSSRVLLMGGIALVTLSIGVGIYAFMAARGEEIAPSAAPTDKTLLSADKKITVSLPRLSRTAIGDGVRNALQNTQANVNAVTLVSFTTQASNLPRGDANETGETALSVRDVLSLIGDSIPAEVSRSIDAAAFGMHTLDRNYPFLVAHIAGLETAFSGMLAWEQAIVRDLAPLLDLSARETELRGRRFEDVIIKNHDARMLTDSTNRIILLYSFVNSSTLILATNEVTFDEAFRRVTAPRRSAD
ncbi:MAG: hypothetical protein HYS74_01015 [Parcubacteria group bacterium]|nr:hypothetical protein [Parcubacteria group bacterium]